MAKKLSRESIALENARLLKKMSNDVEVLKTMTDKKDIKDRLAKIGDTLFYSKVTSKEKVIQIDKQISNRIDDFRIVLTGHVTDEIMTFKLNEIEILITERNTKA